METANMKRVNGKHDEKVNAGGDLVRGTLTHVFKMLDNMGDNVEKLVGDVLDDVGGMVHDVRKNARKWWDDGDNEESDRLV